MSRRFKLLSTIGVCTLCFAVFGVVAWNTIQTTKVNGEWYQRISQGQDLVADILPPPEYIIEAYLVVYQMLEETDGARLQELVKKSKQLRDDYEERHKYWQSTLPEGELKQAMVVKSYGPAIKFFEVRDAQVIPALLRNDREKAHGVLEETLKPLYEEHRLLIDSVVRIADESLKADEAEVKTIISKRGLLLGGLGVAVFCTILICAGFINHLCSTIIGRISRAVTGLSEASGQVASASGQVASVSQQLAEGSSVQAASIEETSSSLEEMSSMIKRNADNSNQANQLMAVTRDTVSRAGESMDELTTSMGEISKASEETSRIIKTIDEIAFQTNLLALNAAVEAARAGETGAGFAVVADEVRNLAMRAAEAAKITADLLEGTVKQVKGGAELVKKTNAEFAEVAACDSRMKELIGEICVASQEQAQGIEQINRAVFEMDKVVQQNAANAEGSASASEEMNVHAEQMKEYVAGLATLVG